MYLLLHNHHTMKIKFQQPVISLMTLVLVFSSLITLTSAKAQTLNEPLARTEDFMNVFMQNGFVPFVDSVFGGTKWMDAKEIQKLKFTGEPYFSKAMNGQIYGFDLVSSAHISDRLMTITYLVRTDRTAIAFRFLWYRPDTQWNINAFNFDTNLDDELREVEKWKMSSWISEN